MRLRLLHAESVEGASEFPPLSLDPPSLTLVAPAPVPEAPPEVEHHEPDWRGRTARSQYRDSEIYQPLSSMLLGRDARPFVLVAVLVLYNGVLGWIVWGASHTSREVVSVLLVVGLGALAGGGAAIAERAYREHRSQPYAETDRTSRQVPV